MGENKTVKNARGDKKLLAFFIIALIVTSFFTYVYRPYIFDNNIEDFDIAGSAPSFFGLITTFFFLSYFQPITPLSKKLVYTTLGCLIYEILQPYFKTGMFDWNDIIAVFLAFLVLSVLYLCSFALKRRCQ